MRGQRKNPRKAVQPFENKKRKIDIFKNYEANGVEKIQRKLEIFSTLISKKSTVQTDVGAKIPNVQYSYRSLRRRSDGQAGKKYVLPGEIRLDAIGYGLREEFGCQIGSQPRP